MARTYSFKTKAEAARFKPTYEAANNAFHNGDSIMLDSDFEALKEALLPWYPEIESHIGATQNASARMVPLPNAMTSQVKARKDTIHKYVDRIGPDTHGSAKADGSSLQIVNVKGVKKLYSRGDAKTNTGQDVSHLIPLLKIGECPPGYAIRFECVLTRAAFEQVKVITKGKRIKDYTAARNVASSGIVNNSRPDPAIVALASCPAFTIYKPKMTPRQAFARLVELGWEVPLNQPITDLSPRALTLLLKTWERTVPYDIDGIVLSKNVHEAPVAGSNPHHSVAFKVDKPPQKVVVSKVVWEASQYGRLKPVAHFVTPVNLNGAEVSKATAHDARMVRTKRIGPGAEIFIIRSGEVIPKIVGVAKPALKASFPKKGTYTWNGANIEAVGDNYRAEILTRQRVAFFADIGVLGLGESVASKLTALSIPEIARKSPIELRALGVGQADSVKLPAAIKKALETTSMPRLMAASSVFGSGFGLTKANAVWAVLKGNPPKTRAELVERVVALHGFSKVSAESFAARYAQWLKFLKDLPFKPIVSGGSGKLVGKLYAFSEFRDKELENFIIDQGGQVKGSVSKATTAVFAPPGANSTKAQKARLLQVPIVPPSQARDFIGYEPKP
jgi:DNA ligase (NAD+)